MAKNYYYLVSGLPELSQKLVSDEFDFSTFLEEIKQHLTPDHQQLLTYLSYPNDNQNFVNVAKQQFAEDKEEAAQLQWSEPYNFTRNQYIELLEDPDISTGLPLYIKNFVLENQTHFRTDKNFVLKDKLSGYFYQELINCDNSFIAKYFLFEQNLKNVISAINCRRFDLDVNEYLVGDSEVNEALAKSSLTDFGLAHNYPWVTELLNLFEKSTPLDLEMGIDQLKWRMIDDINTFEYFSIDVIIGFTVKLLTIERWRRLDAEKGKEMYQKMIAGMKEEFQFPAEFRVRTRRS